LTFYINISRDDTNWLMVGPTARWPVSFTQTCHHPLQGAEIAEPLAITRRRTVSLSTINVDQLQQRIAEGQSVDLIDVRTPAEYREVHATAARNVPLDRLDPAQIMQERNGQSSEPLYLICRSGSRGQKAGQKFLAAGFTNVVNVEGGTQAWEAARLPVRRGKKTISLERQVRIAAGGLALVGSVLGYLVHPYFIGVPAFIGAGLVFAGITDTCGMGMMLARMPWNQVVECDSAGSAT
jgi:rhodanese-related sulfurtransferase